jgi:hypothetical protein
MRWNQPSSNAGCISLSSNKGGFKCSIHELLSARSVCPSPLASLLTGIERSCRVVDGGMLTTIHPIVTRLNPRVNTSVVTPASAIFHHPPTPPIQPSFTLLLIHTSFTMPVAAVTTSAGKLSRPLFIGWKLIRQPGH